MLSCDVDKNLKFYYSRYIYPFNQVIDPLHISNHKNLKCHDLYNPKKATDSIPDCNLMIAEQTFSWLSRYKKILNSMPKNHHLFFCIGLCIDVTNTLNCVRGWRGSHCSQSLRRISHQVAISLTIVYIGPCFSFCNVQLTWLLCLACCVTISSPEIVDFYSEYEKLR